MRNLIACIALLVMVGCSTPKGYYDATQSSYGFPVWCVGDKCQYPSEEAELQAIRDILKANAEHYCK